MASAFLYSVAGIIAIAVPWPIGGCCLLAFGLTKFGFKFHEHYNRLREETN